MKANRILLYSLIFYPDVCSNAYVFTDLANEFKNMGFDISVITTTPHYDENVSLEKKKGLKKGKRKWYYTSLYNGISIYHINVAPKKGGFLTRLITFYKFQHYASRLAKIENIKCDVILGQTPPFTIGFFLKKISKITSGKSIMILQDLFVDSLIDEGILVWPFNKLLKYFENKSVLKADKIVTISEEMKQKLSVSIKNKKDIVIIPNFVDTSIYHPVKENFRQKYGLNDKDFVLSYVGNIGTAQDLSPLLKLAEFDKTIKILIAGNGCNLDKYKKIVKDKQLDCIHFLGYLTREETVEVNSLSDVCLIMLNASVVATSFPSKTYSLLAMGKPIVVSSVENSAIGKFVIDNNLGASVSCRDPNQFINTIEGLKKDQNKLKALGTNGVKLVEEKYNVKCVANLYCSLFGEIL